MARPADPRRRAKTLATAADYVLEHGLAGLSLRPLASALGTSTRMLLYDFSSKEELIMAVLAEIRRREAALLAGHTHMTGASGPELVQSVWEWASSAEHAPFMRLFFEVYAHALRERPWTDTFRATVIAAWERPLVDLFTSHGFAADDARIRARLTLATARGLVLDLLITGERDVLDAAGEMFAPIMTPP